MTATSRTRAKVVLHAPCPLPGAQGAEVRDAARLADLLLNSDTEGFEFDQLAFMIAGIDQLIASLAARKGELALTAFDEFNYRQDCKGLPHAQDLLGGEAGPMWAEIAARTQSSPITTEKRNTPLAYTAEQLPITSNALTEGQITATHAEQLADAIMGEQDPTIVEAVDKACGDNPDRLGPKRLTNQASDVAAGLKPPITEESITQAEAGRAVIFSLQPNGEGIIEVYTSAGILITLKTVLNSAARYLRRRGDVRTMDQLRHDLLMLPFTQAMIDGEITADTWHNQVRTTQVPPATILTNHTTNQSNNEDNGPDGTGGTGGGGIDGPNTPPAPHHPASPGHGTIPQQREGNQPAGGQAETPAQAARAGPATPSGSSGSEPGSRTGLRDHRSAHRPATGASPTSRTHRTPRTQSTHPVRVAAAVPIRRHRCCRCPQHRPPRRPHPRIPRHPQRPRSRVHTRER